MNAGKWVVTREYMRKHYFSLDWRYLTQGDYPVRKSKRKRPRHDRPISFKRRDR